MGLTLGYMLAECSMNINTKLILPHVSHPHNSSAEFPLWFPVERKHAEVRGSFVRGLHF